MADRTEQQLGNYRLLRLLGRGSFAEVYLGQHMYLHSQAALKVLRVAISDEDMENFAKEARILASLNHPHIIRILDFAIGEDTPFLVMEYAANGTLRQRHPPGSRLPSETVVLYVRQIAAALQYAHDQHLVHRDIKPENMLLGSNNEILLSDFGLATLTAHSTDQSRHGPLLVGTTPYLAPEQLQGKPQPASDQYALAVVAYEWLCGKHPFSGTPIEIAKQHISTPLPLLGEQLPGVSSALEEVVMRALAKEPQQRFASIQDFATALERAYQETLQPRFAPLAGHEAPQPILKPGPMWKVPTFFSPIIGRTQEVAYICTQLKRPEVRLLTLLGTGGIGKTRLCMQVAREIQPHFADGVCFVHLAGVHEPDLVVPSIAQELDIQERGTQSILEQVKAALSNKSFLLLLDNFEQVVITAPFIEELLAACPGLKIVVTSREVLHLEAEHQFPVPALSLPPSLNQLPEGEALTQYTAIALFVERAQAVQPTFRLSPANAHATAEICMRLDGLPLAIELAAARIKVLPPQALLARLSQLFEVVAGSSRAYPLRQQTLRNALQWSYDLLTVEEQRLFRRLSVFVGGWTLEAVEAMEKTLNAQEDETISALDGVASLLDKSLLVQTIQEGKDPYLQMLLIVREYGLELLRESGEAQNVQRAHALHYLAYAEEAEPHLKGPQQALWLGRLELEQENLWVALAWLIEHQETDLALRFCAALWRFWYLRGYWSEGRRWLEGALGLEQTESPTIARARALCAAGDLAYYQNDYVAAHILLEQSIALCRMLGVKKELASALGALGILLHVQNDVVAAHPLLEESETLCRTLGSKWELAYLLSKRGQMAGEEHELIQATAFAHEALTLAQELGDTSLVAALFSSLAYLAAIQSDHMQAMIYDRKSLTLARELGNKYLIATSLQNLGYGAALQGDPVQATAYTQEGLALVRKLGDKHSINLAFHTLGFIALLQKDFKQATSWHREGLSLAQEIGEVTQIGWQLIGLASVAEAEGEHWRAACLLGASKTLIDVNASMNDIELANYKGLVERVHSKLGKQVFDAAWALGYTMTPEQALAASESEEMMLELEVAPEQASAPQKPIVLPPFARTYPDGLSAREVEVLCLRARGKQIKEIARLLQIAPGTVSKHLDNIREKTGMTNAAGMTRYALEHDRLCEGFPG